ncbi:hypothetical protein [Microvirga antarctica]|uniref:hypothetical protein n=1 Tax=Microvirga antarctica TaxID=2819233 RepID=UPI001B316841|nr:hypothetical protein [Microvirga antarctica]
MAARVVPDALRQQAFMYYAEHASVPLCAIAVFLGLSARSFRRFRRVWGWPSWPEAIAAASRATITAGATTPPTLSPRSGLRDAAAALTTATRSRLDALMADQAGPEADHDRLARILSTYAKTLTIARTLLDQEGTAPDDAQADEPAPRSLGELRDELAACLERVVADEEARGRDGILV